MKTNEIELRSEAVIWAEGTDYSADQLVRLYDEYVGECEAAGSDPDDCQRFFNRHLKEVDNIRRIIIKRKKCAKSMQTTDAEMERMMMGY